MTEIPIDHIENSALICSFCMIGTSVMNKLTHSLTHSLNSDFTDLLAMHCLNPEQCSLFTKFLLAIFSNDWNSCLHFIRKYATRKSIFSNILVFSFSRISVLCKIYISSSRHQFTSRLTYKEKHDWVLSLTSVVDGKLIV